MPIHYINTKTGDKQIFGGRTIASEYTGVPVEWFYYHFNKKRGGKTEACEGEHCFALRKVIRSERD